MDARRRLSSVRYISVLYGMVKVARCQWTPMVERASLRFGQGGRKICHVMSRWGRRLPLPANHNPEAPVLNAPCLLARYFMYRSLFRLHHHHKHIRFSSHCDQELNQSNHVSSAMNSPLLPQSWTARACRACRPLTNRPIIGFSSRQYSNYASHAPLLDTTIQLPKQPANGGGPALSRTPGMRGARKPRGPRVLQLQFR